MPEIGIEICHLIIDNVQEKNPASMEGGMPFHFAAGRGDLKICHLIINTVLEKNPACKEGGTPLHCAAGKGHLEISRLIMEFRDP